MAGAGHLWMAFGPIAIAIIGDDAGVKVCRRFQDDGIGRCALGNHQHAAGRKVQFARKFWIVLIATFQFIARIGIENDTGGVAMPCLLYTSPSPRD